MIAIDCYNLRFYIYWSQVFKDLSLCLNDDIKAFLIQKDRKCIYLKKYYSKIHDEVTGETEKIRINIKRLTKRQPQTN